MSLRQFLLKIHLSLLLASDFRHHILPHPLELLINLKHLLAALLFQRLLKYSNQFRIADGKVRGEFFSDQLAMNMIRLLPEHRLKRAVHSVGLFEELLDFGLANCGRV